MIYYYLKTPIFSVMLIDVGTKIIHSTPVVFIAKFPYCKVFSVTFFQPFVNLRRKNHKLVLLFYSPLQ